MRLFYCLILLSCVFAEHSLTINDTSYIRCTSSRCSQVIRSFTEVLTFPTECQANNEDENIYDYASTCRITYRINYDYQQVHIDFDANNDTDNIEEQKSSESLFQTLWFRFIDGIHTPNEVTRKYECNTKDDCARDFYLKTIDSLVNFGPSQLELIKTKLYNDSAIVGDRSRRRCYDSIKKDREIKSSKCPNGLCYLRREDYKTDEKNDTLTQECHTNYKPILFSELEYHLPPSPEKDKEILEYTCNKNVCNRDDLIPKIENLIKEFTNWHGINPDSKNINEKAHSSSNTQTISFFTLVLFLIFIQLFI